MNKLPTTAIHYYNKNHPPFVNLSDFHEDDCINVLRKQNERFNKGMCKRSFPDWYMPERREVEKLIRNIFISKGGIAPRNNPHYFWWGDNDYKTYFADDELEKISIDLININKNYISFTWPDSLGFRKIDSTKIDIDLPCGIVFTYDEAIEYFENRELPNGGWLKITHREAILNYVEMQLWSDEPILKYIHGKDCE
jgi:hypothetical protein